MAPAIDTTALGEMPLFRGLDADQLARIGQRLRRQMFPADAHILSVGQPGEVAYLIRSGTVKVHVEQSDGRDVIVALRGPGELVGELSLLDDHPRTASAVTLEPCEMLWIDRASFAEYLAQYPAVSLNLIKILARRLRVATTQVQILSTQDLYGRVAHLLLTLANEFGETELRGGRRIPLRLTQSDLASLIGASRPRVNQILTFYKERGHIAMDAQYRITVLDEGALAQRSS
jgi:CRP/FNR family cyclic AMP-dependent transcriptional regulator